MRIPITKASNQYFGKDFEKIVYKKLSGVELPLSGKGDFVSYYNEISEEQVEDENFCSS